MNGRGALPPGWGVGIIGRFSDISGLFGLDGNADMGARKHAQNAQKYLWKLERWSEKGLILAIGKFFLEN